jgi:hypothetical protein
LKKARKNFFLTAGYGSRLPFSATFGGAERQAAAIARN